MNRSLAITIIGIAGVVGMYVGSCEQRASAPQEISAAPTDSDPSQRLAGTIPVGFFGANSDVRRSFDLTASCTTTGISCTRSTGTVYAQTGANTFSALSGGTCAWESRGDGTPGGCQSFAGFANMITSPLDLTNGAWGHGANITPTTGGGSNFCPDGSTASVTVVTETATGAVSAIGQNVSTAAGTANGGLSMAWYRGHSGNVPAQAGWIWENYSAGFHVPLFSPPDTTWRLAVTGHAIGSTNDVINIFPAGTNPAVGALGALDVCGTSIPGDPATASPQLINSILPIPSSSTTAQTLSLATPAQALDNSELDFEVSFVGDWWRSFAMSPQNQDFYFWKMATPDGELSLKYDHTGGTNWILTVRGVTALTIVGANSAMMYSNTTDANMAPVQQEQTIRCWYKPVTTGQGGCVSTVNGTFQQQTTFSTTGGALAAPTSVYLGSDGSANFMQARFTSVKVYKNTASNAVYTAQTVVLGDSLFASNGEYTATASHICTANEIRANTCHRIASLALGGDTITGQTSVYNASRYKTDTGIKTFILMPGSNSVPDGETTMATNYQTLVTTIRTDHPSAKVICMALTPRYGWWVTNVGTTLANTYETTRTNFNNDIMNTGAHNITGCDVRENGHLAGLTAGDGKSLLAACDEGTGLAAPDGLHYTSCRNWVVAPVVRADLVSLGNL